jgi:hypothetical protein
MTAPAVPQAKMPARIATSFQCATAITPADNVAIGPFSAFYVGVSGDVTVIMRNGDAGGGLTPVLFKAMPVGRHDYAIQCVNATGTTATNLVGLG